MAIEARGEATISRPVEEVFDYLGDARNEPSWLPGATSVAGGAVGVGSRFVGRYRRAGRVELEPVEFERPRRVTFGAHPKIVDFETQSSWRRSRTTHA